jgi:hypothetical protein
MNMKPLEEMQKEAANQAAVSGQVFWRNFGH